MMKIDPARLLLIPLAALAVIAFAQRPGEPRGAGGGSRPQRVHPRTVPFFALTKTVGFPVVFAGKGEFLPMIALAADATPKMVPGLKKPTVTVQLEYGSKKGGLGDVYEMPMQPGLDAKSAFQAMLDGRVYHDHNYFKGWTIKGVPDKNLLIAVSGTTPEVRDALIKAIGR